MRPKFTFFSLYYELNFAKIVQGGESAKNFRGEKVPSVFMGEKVQKISGEFAPGGENSRIEKVPKV